MRCAERETLLAHWIGVGGGQGEHMEAGCVADVDVADEGGVPDVGVQQAINVSGRREAGLARVCGEGKCVSKGTVDEGRVD
jgi:hypothetical protein